MGVALIRECCLGWWRDGFSENGYEEMRALLDEMVGLGVLRENSGKY